MQPDPADRSDNDVESSLVPAFDLLLPPRLVVFERNTLALGRTLRKLILEQVCSTPTQLARREAWLYPAEPTSELLNLQREYKRHGVDVASLLVDFFSSTQSGPEATAALKLITALNERRAVMEKLMIPVLESGSAIIEERRFQRAFDIAQHLRPHDVEALVEFLHLPELAKDPASITRLSSGLHVMFGAPVVTPLAQRFVRELRDGTPISQAMLLATAAQVVLLLSTQDNSRPWRLPQHLQSTIQDLYVHTPAGEELATFATLLTASNAVTAVDFFRSVLTQCEQSGDPLSRRFVISSHFATAALRLPGGEEQVAAQLQNTPDHWIRASLVASLASSPNDEGRFKLAELLAHEIAHEDKPYLLASVAGMARFVPVREIFDYVLDEHYPPERLIESLSATATCDFCRCYVYESKICFPPKPNRSPTLAVDLIERIGEANLTYWLLEGTPHLRQNIGDFLMLAYQQDTARTMSLLTKQQLKSSDKILERFFGIGSDIDAGDGF